MKWSMTRCSSQVSPVRKALVKDPAKNRITFGEKNFLVVISYA